MDPITVLGLAVGIVGAVAAVTQVLLELRRDRRRVEKENRYSFLPVTKPARVIDPIRRHILRGESIQALASLAKVYKAMGEDERAELAAGQRSDQIRDYVQASGISPQEMQFLQGIPDKFFLATLLLAQGEALAYMGKKSAIPLLREAIQVMDTAETRDESQIHLKKNILGTAYNNIGYVYRSFRNYGNASKEYARALPYLRGSTNQVAYAGTLKNMAHIYALQGKVTVAELICLHALDVFHKAENPIGEALSLNTLGLTYAAGKQYSLADDNCRQALATFESLNNPRGVGLACTALGYTSRRSIRSGLFRGDKAIERFREGKRFLTRSIDIFTGPASEPIRLIEAHNELGCICRDWSGIYRSLDGQTRDLNSIQSEAVEQLEHARELAKQNGMIVEEADTLEDMAELQFGCRDYHTAVDLLDEAEALIPADYYKISGLPTILDPVPDYWALLGKTTLLRGHIAFDAGQKKEASSQYVRASAYFDLYAETSTQMDFAIRGIYARLQYLGPDELADWRRFAMSRLKELRVDNTRLIKMLDEALGVLEVDSQIKVDPI